MRIWPLRGIHFHKTGITGNDPGAGVKLHPFADLRSSKPRSAIVGLVATPLPARTIDTWDSEADTYRKLRTCLYH